MDEQKPKNLHVIFKNHDEFHRLERMRGQRKWRDWLLTLPEQFRDLTERIRLFRERAELAERENEELKERLRRLQEKMADE